MVSVNFLPARSSYKVKRASNSFSSTPQQLRILTKVMDPTNDNNSILTIRPISNCLSISNFVTFFLLISSFNLPQRSSGDGSSEKETTLAIIKPDGLFGNYTSLIKKIILDSGFSIPREMMVQLDDDSVKIFYAEHSSKSFFPSLVTYMTSGPVLIMILEKVNAISDWRDLIGPTDARKAKITHPRSIRVICGIDLTRNCVHGSDSRKSAAREISFFFKETSTGGFATNHDEL